MEIGVHCSESSCKRLDFLPFTCELCQKLFCSNDHRFPEQHGCHQKPPSPPHHSHEAKNELRSYVCSVPDCKRKEMMEVNCPHCEHTFCLQHRHQVDHNCPKLVKQPPKASKTGHRPGGAATIERSATEQAKTWSPAKASRMESTRNKVLLMKLKMKAEGSDAIPMSERVYYNVLLPAAEVGSQQLPSSKPMFFSMEWSIGKVVDSIAQRYKLKNENHKPHSGHKLVLHNVNGEAVEMSQPLKSFLNNGLPNGGSLVLKYVTSC